MKRARPGGGDSGGLVSRLRWGNIAIISLVLIALGVAFLDGASLPGGSGTSRLPPEAGLAGAEPALEQAPERAWPRDRAGGPQSRRLRRSGPLWFGARAKGALARFRRPRARPALARSETTSFRNQPVQAQRQGDVRKRHERPARKPLDTLARPAPTARPSPPATDVQPTFRPPRSPDEGLEFGPG